jgi:hypothetical protein
MVNTKEKTNEALDRFQQLLDDTFPEGGVCAVLERKDGILQAAAVVINTGRLVCKDASYDTAKGWTYEIEIGGQDSADPDSKPMRVRVTTVLPHPTVKGLWEAPVISEDGGVRLLRINTRT